MALTLLPSVLFGPLAGTLADRFDRKICMIIADGCRFFLVAAMALLLLRGAMTLPAMYILVFCIACFMPLFESAAEGSLVSLTDREGLSAAAAINSSVVELSNVCGAALGGIALAAVGTAGAFGFNGMTFAVSLALIATVKRSLAPGKGSESASAKESLSEIFSWLRHNHDVLILLVMFGVLNFFAAPLMVSIPMMVRYAFEGSVSWVAFLEASLALGAVSLAFAMSFTSGGKTLMKIFAGVMGLGLSVTFFALSPSLPVALPVVFCAGAGLALVNAASMGFFQHRVPDFLKGRFFSILTAVAYSVMPLALVLNGVVSQFCSVRIVLAVDGVMVCLLSGAVFLGPLRESQALRAEETFRV
jgi:MFS family permease